MSRPLGGYIGHRPVPAAAELNSVARGIWTLREAQRLKQAGTWPRALPPDAILAVNFDAGFDDLAQGLTASQTGSGVALSSAQSKAGGQSLLVRTATNANNTTSNRVTYGSGSNWDITGADFTAECWVYNTANGLYQGIICRDNQTDRRNWQFLKLSDAEGNQAFFGVYNTSSGVFLSVTDSAALPLNQWVHLAGVRDSGVLRLYRDGVQRASANFSSGTGTRSTASGPLAIGAINENGNFAFSGYIDEVLITTSCRYPNGTTFTPPASIGVGVSAPAVPQTISGLQLWLDAADPAVLYDATTGGSLVAADGGVARWEDKSGNGRHATQGTSGDRPARKTSVQGGKDVLRFDGTSDFMTVPSSTAAFKFLHDGDSTVFLVVKVGASANPGHGRYTLLSNIRDGGSNHVGFETNHRDSDPSTENDFIDLVVVKGLNANYPVASSANNFFASGTFGVLSAVLKPADATSGNRVSLRRNGGAANTANSPVGANQTVSTADADQDLNISRRPGQAYPADGFVDGDYCEIIIYDSALSDANRELVETYLMGKWGIT